MAKRPTLRKPKPENKLVRKMTSGMSLVSDADSDYLAQME